MNIVKSGVVGIDITPPVGYWMGGYGARTGPSEMVHDPLGLRILTLFDGTKRFVIVTADLISFSDEFCVRVKREIELATGVKESELILASSHTHAGPLMNDKSTMLPDPKYFAEDYRTLLIKKICGGVNEAVLREEEVTLSHAKGTANIGINRRKKTNDGVVRMAPNPDGPLDDDVQVVVIKRLDGSVHAILFKACCHPTTLGSNYAISADYPGVARRVIENSYPGSRALFLNGCAGDVRPNIVDDENKFTSGTFEDVERLGNILAKEVVRCCDIADPLDETSINSRIVEHSLEFDPDLIPKNESDVDTLRDTVIGTCPDLEPYANKWAECIKEKFINGDSMKKSMDMKFTILNIGKLSIVFLPGEVMVEYGLQIKELTSGKKVIVIAYANEDIDYVPTKEAIAEGGYEAYAGFVFENHPAPYSPEIEERLITDIIKELRKQEVC